MTLRVVHEVRNLRTKSKHQLIRSSFVATCNGKGFRITDWSIQGDHLHLIVEARNREEWYLVPENFDGIVSDDLQVADVGFLRFQQAMTDAWLVNFNS